MSRVIKFRAFIKHLQILVKIESIDFITKMVEVDLTGGEGDTTWFTFENVKLVQYTGLKDKNGKEIFEGDILNCRTLIIKTMKWSESQEVIEDIIQVSYFINYDELEVIGNIYENPELLEATA